jgi:hypothetical protein
MSASVNNAEAYFAPANHLRAAVWAKFDETQKAGAIAHAKRILNRACTLDDIETEIDVTMEINPEYAIYEQALYMLMNLPMDNRDGSFAVALAADPKAEGKARKAETGLIAPEALAWLTGGSGVELSRG